MDTYNVQSKLNCVSEFTREKKRNKVIASVVIDLTKVTQGLLVQLVGGQRERERERERERSSIADNTTGSLVTPKREEEEEDGHDGDDDDDDDDE